MSYLSSSVVHNEKEHNFQLPLGDNEYAVVNYNIIGPDKLEYYHVEVPKSHQGKGIASIVSRGALDWAVNNNKKVKLTCTYLTNTFITNNNNKSKYEQILL